MSRASEDYQDGSQISSGSLKNLRVAVNRRDEPRLPASVSLSHNTPSNLMGDRTSIAPDVETPTSYPNLTMPEGDLLRPSVILPAPWRQHEEPLQSKPASKSMGSTTGISSQSNVALCDMRAAWHHAESIDNESGGRLPHNVLPTLPTDILVARFATTEHNTVEPTQGQQSQLISRSTDLGLSLGPRLPPGPGTAVDEVKYRPVEMAEVEPVSNEEKKETREEPKSVQSSAASAGIKRKRSSPRPISPAPRTMKTNQRPGRKYEMQWRVGRAPTTKLKDTKEQTNFDRVLAAVARYYEGNADGTWRTALHHNTSEYDGKGLTEAVGASIIMAAGLIAAGQPHSAAQVLNRALPLAEVMLLSQHPQVCFWLIEALGPRPSDLAPSKNSLTTEQRVRMRTEGQVVAHDYHVRTFGTYSYQTMAQQWFWGRITAASGRFEEAVRLLQDLTQTWEQVHSTPNSAVVVSALVEQARVMVASGDASVKVECLLGDALRRIDVLSSAQSLNIPITDAAELRMREGGLLFSRLAALRALGRVHAMRWNLSAAIFCFEQATAIAEAQLTEQSSVRMLCETDLEVTKMMELERAMGVLSVDDPTSRLPPISSIISLIPIET